MTGSRAGDEKRRSHLTYRPSSFACRFSSSWFCASAFTALGQPVTRDRGGLFDHGAVLPDEFVGHLQASWAWFR